MNEHVRRLQAGERLDPIEVIEIPGRGRFIIDGHHRYVASHQSGIPVPIRVTQGSGPIGMPNWLNVEWRKFLNDTQFFD